MTTIPVELLPCPFCGGSPWHANGFMPLESIYYVGCASTDCLLYGIGKFEPDDWNHRALLAEQPQAGAGSDLKQLEDVLDDVCGKEGGIPTGVPLYTISLTEVAEAFRRLTTQPPARHDQADEVRRLRKALDKVGNRLEAFIADEMDMPHDSMEVCKAIIDAALTQSQKGEEE